MPSVPSQPFRRLPAVRRRPALDSLLVALAVLVTGMQTAAGPVEDATTSDGLYTVFETTLGTFVARLEPEKTPVTVGNFVGLVEGTRDFTDPRSGVLVRRHFYDGLKFHRVVPGFVVQGGDPRGDGTGGPGYEFMDEFDPSLHFDRPGVLAMANAGPDKNGSQFFVTLAAAPHLDGHHSVFGHVVYGMEVVQSMAKQPRTGADKSIPVSDIVMRRVRTIRSGSQAATFDAATAFARQEEMRARRVAAQRAAAEAFQEEMARDRARAERTATGLLYIVLQSGSGEPPKVGDTISTHCTGFLEKDGTRFWSTHDRGEPFRVVIGVGKVIKAWEEAYLEMRPGERRRLIVPPDLGYGAQGNPRAGIPGNAWLIFDVELLAVERR